VQAQFRSMCTGGLQSVESLVCNCFSIDDMECTPSCESDVEGGMCKQKTHLCRHMSFQWRRKVPIQCNVLHLKL
jgi:hypothetical protein